MESELGIVKGEAYRIPAVEVEELARDPEVVHISLYHHLQSAGTAPASAFLDYYDAAVNAPAGWLLGLDGSGIGVAVIDSGITDVPDLHRQKYRVVYAQNFNGTGSAVDLFGHGTHVAGIVVVVAAGNDGRDNTQGTEGHGTINCPGNDPYVITVGAMKTMRTPSRSDDLLASYSAKGPTMVDHLVKPDIVAPGNLLISLYRPGLTLPKSYPGNEIPNSLYMVNGNANRSTFYYRLSGTRTTTLSNKYHEPRPRKG